MDFRMLKRIRPVKHNAAEIRASEKRRRMEDQSHGEGRVGILHRLLELLAAL